MTLLKKLGILENCLKMKFLHKELIFFKICLDFWGRIKYISHFESFI